MIKNGMKSLIVVSPRVQNVFDLIDDIHGLRSMLQQKLIQLDSMVNDNKLKKLAPSTVLDLLTQNEGVLKRPKLKRKSAKAKRLDKPQKMRRLVVKPAEKAVIVSRLIALPDAEELRKLRSKHKSGPGRKYPPALTVRMATFARSHFDPEQRVGLPEIAEALNVSSNTVSRWISKDFKLLNAQA